MTLQVPNSDDSIEVQVEVVLSNIYGPDDDISPRGMIVRFLEISSEDRKIMAKAILQQLQSDNEEIDSKQLKALKTLTIDQKAIGPPPAWQ